MGEPNATVFGSWHPRWSNLASSLARVLSDSPASDRVRASMTPRMRNVQNTCFRSRTDICPLVEIGLT